MLVILWITVQSVKLLLDSVELPIIRSLKHGVVDCESDSMKGKRESWSEWVMDHRGAVKASDELGCISIFFLSLFHPDIGKEMLFVFLRMCNFLLFIPSESSCRILKPSNWGFKRPLAAVMAPCRSFLPMLSGDSVRSGRKTDQFVGKKRERIFQKPWQNVRNSVSYGASIKPVALFAVITGKCYKFCADSESRVENIEG